MNITNGKNNNNFKIQNEILIKNKPKNSKYEKLYKIIQNEIKNIVITKLHIQIEKLIKELEKLKKENIIIKNDLIYILKRILNNKTEYNIINKSLSNNHNNSCINLKPNTSLVTLNKSKNSFLSTEKTNTNMLQNNNHITNTSRTKISLIRTVDNISNILTSDNNIKSEENKYHIDKNKYKNIDNKIDSYLNSLYRHNFVENHIGYENKYNLNNSKGIYDELFNTQNSILESKINHNSQKNIRISVDDKTEKGKSYSMKKIKNNSKYFNYRKKIDHFKLNLNKNEKNNLNISTNKKNKNKRKIINENKMNRNGNDSVSNNMTSGKKSNSKIKIIYTNRSPFLINKF